MTNLAIATTTTISLAGFLHAWMLPLLDALHTLPQVLA
jgi:hypothetical protein